MLCLACRDLGYFWPQTVDGDTSRQWVERCDTCAAFGTDEKAAQYIAVHFGVKIGLDHMRPYVRE